MTRHTLLLQTHYTVRRRSGFFLDDLLSKSLRECSNIDMVTKSNVIVEEALKLIDLYYKFEVRTIYEFEVRLCW